MTSLLEIGEGGIDPHAEVRKLQDLVKKLETQNEVLRRKQKLGDSNIIEHQLENENEVLKPSVNNSVFYNTRKHTERNQPTVVNTDTLDNVELIDTSSSLADNEDSWLYTSPRPATPLQNGVSPYKWVRQDFDHPSPEVQSARKSFKYRLDEVARMSRSSSTPALQNYSTPPRGNVTTMSLSADSDPSPAMSIPSPRIMKPHPSKPSMMFNPSLEGMRVNTGTFTRPKRTKDKPSPVDIPADDSIDKPSPVGIPADDSKENIESITQYPNVSDIENVAKMQEESLRQSLAQTSPRRGFRSRPLPNVSMTTNNNECNSASSADSNRSSPFRFEEGMNRKNSNNSAGSDHSSPPDSPYGSNQLLQPHYPGKGSMRGSVPNISHLTPHAQHHNSDSSLANYYPEELAIQNAEPPKYSRLQNQLARPSSPSISGLKQSERTIRGASPQRTGLPTPKRSIAKPGNTSTPKLGVHQPKRISGLPAPKSNSSSYRNEDSWRDGCF